MIKAAYVQRACSVLLERDAVMLANPAMDITDAVIAGLNARIKTFAFDRERLDAQPAAAAPRTQ
ncbi:Outer membrane protein (OmpH-like) [compost metagenome]